MRVYGEYFEFGGGGGDVWTAGVELPPVQTDAAAREYLGRPLGPRGRRIQAVYEPGREAEFGWPGNARLIAKSN